MGVRSASVTNAGEITAAEIPRRAYFSNWGFFEVAAGIPKDTGVNYTLTPTLAAFGALQERLHGSLRSEGIQRRPLPATLPADRHEHPANGMKLVSVDQQIADFYQGQTRVPSLVLSIERKPALSLSRNKTPINPEVSPKAVFDRLFGVENEQTRNGRRDAMAHTSSILDRVKDQAKRLEKKLGKDDRATVEQYFTSIRDFEERIKIDRAWLDKPKPEVAPMDFGKGSLEKDALAERRWHGHAELSQADV